MANKESNSYIFMYSTILVVVAAAVLAVAAVGLKPFQKKNQEIEKMQQLLTAVGIENDVKNAEDLYKKYFVQELAVNKKGEVVSTYENQTLKGEERPFNIELSKQLAKGDEAMLPIFICNQEGKTVYVVPVHGKGLYDAIWGNVAIADDLNTIVGVLFDHKGETPGLGAEITNPAFPAQFKGKKIFENDEVKLAVVKSSKKTNDTFEADAVTGATNTSNGVSNMLKDCLSNYVEYFKTLKTK
ncbi:MAG: NADH:ubiquinone reductase (Na(+)-transporting) subunit C [Bacteroidales bacterium]|jgi:Na+-transporting NADH:ubiquinone oxidoreductase subunit C|nr:NADH:ubiquinone reductase (Na(+)-transporting) subunit C [Bacteroidales bacterium]MEE0883210.1 NADH:ubiquinone reductase (Na(+)-transporting) subunit C [Bacteroidales bacterium]MEE1252110.1 NADH:ubiquinone reductase (Na(+)-transporting) subunit C [Bacteroidales bacterium]MEE1272650.1 NADH:ubiquinone reductase (Na(+)-transporting) subunit C [Bacteroidales bacterium]